MKRQPIPDKWGAILSMGLDWFLWWLVMHASVRRALRQGLIPSEFAGEAVYMELFGLPFGMAPEDVAEYLEERDKVDDRSFLSALKSGGGLGMRMARMLVRKSLQSADVVDFKQYRAMAKKEEEEMG